MADLMRPIVNLNGTSPEALIRSRMTARVAIDNLLTALRETAPNGRDYIGDNAAFDRDTAIYRSRFIWLDALSNDLMDEAIAIKGDG